MAASIPVGGGGGKKRKAGEARLEDGKDAKRQQPKKPKKEVKCIKSDVSVIMFNSKSKAQKPFRGAQEQLVAGDSVDRYPVLQANPNFRQVLSAFHVTRKPIVHHNGAHYATQEHAYHAAKFIRLHPDFARLFDVRSGSEFCKDPKLAKMAGGKRGEVRVDKKVVYKRPKAVVLDPQWRPTGEHMVQLIYAKYMADERARDILRGTGGALLTHWTRGKSEAVVEHDLMRVRDMLSLPVAFVK